MPDATITSTASTFGTITGTFAADQSTVTGTVTGVITGTLTGSVGVPGPQGPTGSTGATGATGPAGSPGSPGVGVPVGGTAGQFLTKIDGTNYNTDWTTVNLSAYAVKANNLSDLASASTARTNLGLGTMATETAADYLLKAGGTITGNIVSNTNSIFSSYDGVYKTVSFNGTSLQLNNAGPGGSALTLEWDGITFASGKQTVHYPGAATLFTSPVLTGDPTAPTPATSDNDTSIATTAFVKAQGYLTSAPVTSVAGRTGAITLSNTDISGLGSLAVVNDAPSDGSQYARKNGAWDVVSAGASYISSVSSPLSVTTGNLTIDLSAYAPLASPVFTGDARAVTPTFGDNDTSIATTAFVQAGLAGGTAIARNLEVEVRNQSGASIPAGSIVYISGATGNKPLITLAQANNDANSAQTMGFTATAIANNAAGYVIVRGECQNLDTSALTEGVQLYLSPTVAGAYTVTKPSAPQHLVYVGIVIRSHPTLGTILVAVQNGYELNELHDVAISAVADNNLLAYEASTTLWKNKTFSALGLLTSATAATTYMPLTPSGITMSAGGAVITIPIGGVYTVSNTIYNNGILIRDGALTPIARFASTEVLIPSVGITFSDASVQTTAGISAATVSSTYAPIDAPTFTGVVTIPAGASISGFAPLASPALTGNVTITSSTGAALFITQTGTGNILTLHDQASDTNFVAIDASGKVNTVVADATTAGLNVPHTTVAPTTPVNGDIWSTTAGLFMRINAGNQQFAALSTNNTFSNASSTYGNSTATGTINVASGATISASTKTVNVATGGVSGSTTTTTIGPVLGASTTSIGNTTAASTLNLATGATLTATTKAVNIGTSGVAGSTTNIAIGSTTGTSTTTLQGATNGVTQAAGNSTTLLATTAFVTTADNLKADLASPTFTGTPTLPTGTIGVTQTAGNNTTAVATTAFVTAAVAGGGAVTSVAGRTGAVVLSNTDISGLGTMATATAADYSTTAVANALYYPLSGNPSGFLTSAPVTSVAGRTGAITLAVADVSGAAPLASPTFTGTPTLPTGTIATTQTAGNNTTAVATTAFVTAAIPTNNVKAWVNFNGTGTVAIRASMNVSSITDNGAGSYTVNFTTALADADYAVSGSVNDATGGSTYLWLATGSAVQSDISRTTSLVRVQSIYGTNSKLDATTINVVITR